MDRLQFTQAVSNLCNEAMRGAPGANGAKCTSADVMLVLDTIKMDVYMCAREQAIETYKRQQQTGIIKAAGFTPNILPKR